MVSTNEEEEAMCDFTHRHERGRRVRRGDALATRIDGKTANPRLPRLRQQPLCDCSVAAGTGRIPRIRAELIARRMSWWLERFWRVVGQAGNERLREVSR